jgi:hypothetical protein
MNWLLASTPVPNAGIVTLLLAAGLAVAFLGYQTWQCRRWHCGIAAEGEFTAWDDQRAEEIPAAERTRETA